MTDIPTDRETMTAAPTETDLEPIADLYHPSHGWCVLASKHAATIARAEAAEAREAALRNEDAAFERVWAVVRDWDISTTPGISRIYEGINGDHVRAIIRAALRNGEGRDDG